MNLSLTEDQELIASTARELLESRAATAGARAVDADPAGYSVALWKEMVDLGWTGLAFPEDFGGVGGDFLDVCLLFEQLGYALVPSPLLASVACAGMPVARFGTDAQKERWLGAIAEGHVVTAAPLPWDRPGDAPVATPDGDGFTLSGTATFVPFAASAESLLVAARLDGEPRAFWVDASAVTIRPLDTVGLDRPCHVELADVRADDALGPDAVQAMARFGAAAMCAEMVGGAQRVLDMTVAYATEREQFGKPIGSFQAVQHHCADMAIDVLGSRFIAYEAIWLLASGRDAADEVSMAKAWVSEAYERVCALGHQVHGAIGFTAEHDLHLFSRHATSAALAFGDGDQHYDVLAGALDVQDT
ncbi:acyl-CoA dehydrogenase family protein [Actinomadura decatromicini]|uniref:Acyl-CoA dehydrogenase n=1 Tax=Actinomadura decatromicini TaxID=2604572 RepID=A0A5D3FI89_9ACTN|nr:acyl-CoA dehydrogenase family protein [Actinomadura decatromicini]TYK47015.1 acyl-CoA dehydrogenase [Actinomadura decatromicini]